MKRFLIIVTITITTLVSCSKENTTEQTPKDIYFNAGINRVTKEQLSPDFTLPNINGEEISLSDFKGQAVLLNFWASWCGPCISEMPSIESLYEKTKDLDVKIIAVNIGEKKETAIQFINDKNFTFEVLLDPQNIVATQYGVRSIPTTYLIDKDGYIQGGKLGALQWDSDEIIEILTGLSK